MDVKPRRFPRFLTQRSIPAEIKAAVTKLQSDPQGSTYRQKNVRLPDSRVLNHVANTTIGNIRDAKNLFQVLPDMGFAREIVIAATLSPGDLTSNDILYRVTDDSLDSNLTGPMLRIIQEFFDDTYRIKNLLHPILKDVLFETGSYPMLVLPESSIDYIINADNYSGASMESMLQDLDRHVSMETNPDGSYTSWGILGHPEQTGKVDSYAGVSFESLTDRTVRSTVDMSKFKVSFEHLADSPEMRERLSVVSRDMSNLISSQESMFSITDNLSILKRPMVIEAKRKMAVQRIYGGKFSNVSFESKRGKTSKDAEATAENIEKAFFKKRRYTHVPVQPVVPHAVTGTRTYGHPLVMHLPSEAIVPIHTPGDPSDHVGYYILLDIDGNPIHVADQSTYFDDIRAQMNNVDSYASQIIQQARRGIEGMGGLHNELVNEMSRMHASVIEQELLNRLKAGPLAGNYELGDVNSIHQLMLARQLKGQRTNLLFVPAEMLIYIAFDYNEFGVGKSVLEDGKILGSIRSALMLGNTLATLNNAVGGKTIEITLDPEDEDPVSTVEFLLSEHAKVNAQGFSRIVGSTHPLGLADQIQNHGVNVVVQGNTRYPETRMEVSARDGTSSPVDMDMEEEYRKRHIQMFGLSPEMMEGINQSDFATTVVNNNLMLLKRVMQTQEKFEPFLTDFIRSYTLSSSILIKELREFVLENLKFLPDWMQEEGRTSGQAATEFVDLFVSSIEVELPSPKLDDLSKSMEAYGVYSSALDECLDAYISSDMFAMDTTIGMEEYVDNIKAVTKAEFQRRWLRKHNVLSELDIFNTVDENEDSPAFNLLDTVAEHVDGLNGSIADYVTALVEAAQHRTKKLHEFNAAKEQLEEYKENAGGVDDSGGDSDDSDGGDDDFGDDDFDMDDEGGEDDDLDTDTDEDVEEEDDSEEEKLED